MGGGLSGSGTTRCWPHCLGASIHAQPADRSSLQLHRDAQATARAEEHAFQKELLASLRSDPHYRPFATEEVVSRNQRLVGIWDALSLVICSGRTSPQSWEQVPSATGATRLQLFAHDDDPHTLFLTPWPFQRQSVTCVYEGRYLTETFSDESVMRYALTHAPWVTLQTVLFPKETE